jgi:hypothetical protein
MKLQIVFDEDGGIIAAAELESDAPVQVRPIADERAGHRAAEFAVPREYSDHDLAAVCQRLAVDAAGEIPELKAKS